MVKIKRSELDARVPLDVATEIFKALAEIGFECKISYDDIAEDGNVVGMKGGMQTWQKSETR